MPKIYDDEPYGNLNDKDVILGGGIVRDNDFEINNRFSKQPKVIPNYDFDINNYDTAILDKKRERFDNVFDDLNDNTKLADGEDNGENTKGNHGNKGTNGKVGSFRNTPLTGKSIQLARGYTKVDKINNNSSYSSSNNSNSSNGGNSSKQNGHLEESCTIQYFRKPRKPLNEHPLNTVYKEDAMDLLSKGLMLGGVTIISKGVSDALGAKYAPLVQGATIVGAGALIYKLTEQDIKKYYRNYISRLEGNYDDLISYNDYRQFVKKYNFKYEEDYYMLNDILAGKEDPVEFNKFLEMNRYNTVNRNIAI